jgi:DNA-binding CsgD family transcriptional regulator
MVIAMDAARGGSKGVQVLDLEASLETIARDGASALAVVVAPLADLLGAEKTLACGLMASDRGPALDVAFARGIAVAENRQAIEALLRSPLGVGGRLDPLLLDPRQRNVALTSEDVTSLLGSEEALPEQAMAQLGISGLEILRVLLCHGANVLAWVGAMRARPFTAHDRSLMQTLVPALLKRLTYERRLADTQVPLATLAAVLESVSGEAFLLRDDESVLLANSIGRRLLERDPLGPASALHEKLAGRGSSAFVVTPVAAAGQPARFLVFRPSGALDPSERSSALGARFRLTKRQCQVLALLARGQCNKSISAALGCAEGTVELHVSALLAKLGCSSRAETVARFWTEAWGPCSR